MDRATTHGRHNLVHLERGEAEVAPVNSPTLDRKWRIKLDRHRGLMHCPLPHQALGPGRKGGKTDSRMAPGMGGANNQGRPPGRISHTTGISLPSHL